MKCEMLNGMLDVVDMEEVLRGDEEHVSGTTYCTYCTLFFTVLQLYAYELRVLYCSQHSLF